MASSSSVLHLLAAAASVALLISPSLSLCDSKTSSDSITTFDHCMNLPTLNAFLRWTHNTTVKPKPTLSIAFTVPELGPNLWVAWALNPTQTGMLGAQALIATQNVSTYVVKTYNISSAAYTDITESKISYNVLNMSAVGVNGSTTIFATLELPDAKPVLNQVWQVGPLRADGKPGAHNTTEQNLNARASLALAGGAAEAPAGSPTGSPPASSAAAPGPAAGEQGGNSTSRGERVRGDGLLYGVVSVMLWASYFGLL